MVVFCLFASHVGCSYNMVSGGADGIVRLWDLRKTVCLKTFDCQAAVNSVNIDHSGTFLAVGASDVRVLHAKKFTEHAKFGDAEEPVFGVALTNDARTLATVSMDRNLRFYGI